MNEYLDEVIEEIQEIPEDDRFDLIQYYEEYFLDSGKTIDQIIEEYGTPKQFALKLKINYFSEQDDSATDEVNPRSSKRQIRFISLYLLLMTDFILFKHHIDGFRQLSPHCYHNQ